jgi:hypothetical protein
VGYSTGFGHAHRQSKVVAAILRRSNPSFFLFSLYLGRAFESARQTVGYKRGCRPEKIHSFLSILDELSYDV